MIQPVDDVPDGVPVISSRSDLKRIEQALRNNWEMPEQVFRSLPDQLVNIVTNGSPREQIAAARVLVAMHAQNTAAQTRTVAHAHVHRVEATNDSTAGDRRAALAARIARLR